MDALTSPTSPAEFNETIEVPAVQTPRPLVSPASSPGLGPMLDVPVTVRAVLGGARMRVDELLATTAGSVIELDRRVGEPIDLLVNDRLIARGELVLVDGLLGVTLTEIVRAEA